MVGIPSLILNRDGSENQVRAVGAEAMIIAD
jgi:hypothetical protein